MEVIPPLQFRFPPSNTHELLEAVIVSLSRCCWIAEARRVPVRECEAPTIVTIQPFVHMGVESLLAEGPEDHQLRSGGTASTVRICDADTQTWSPRSLFSVAIIAYFFGLINLDGFLLYLLRFLSPRSRHRSKIPLRRR